VSPLTATENPKLSLAARSEAPVDGGGEGFPSLALAGLDEAPLPVDAARNTFACSPQIIMTDFFEELQRLVRYLLLGHDGNRVDFHEEIRIRQACDEEHGDRRRVGPVSPRAPECLKARLD
jgi:hypothetical protein